MAKIDLEKYVTVDVRIQRFYEKYPDGAILTECLHVDDRVVRFKAAAYSHRTDSPTQPVGIGHAEEYRITEAQIKNNSRLRDLPNATSAVENCETSAVGRALAMAGLEVTKGVASRSEMEKVERQQEAGSTKKVESEVDKEPKADTVPTNGAEPESKESNLTVDQARQVAGRIKATGIEMSAVKMKLTAMGIETPKTLAGSLQDMTMTQVIELEAWVKGETDDNSAS